MKKNKKRLLLTTTMTLNRPYEELGLVWSISKFWWSSTEKTLEKEALRRYPQADAIIGIRPGTALLSVVGTVVRYKE